MVPAFQEARDLRENRPRGKKWLKAGNWWKQLSPQYLYKLNIHYVNPMWRKGQLLELNNIYLIKKGVERGK